MSIGGFFPFMGSALTFSSTSLITVFSDCGISEVFYVVFLADGFESFNFLAWLRPSLFVPPSPESGTVIAAWSSSISFYEITLFCCNWLWSFWFLDIAFVYFSYLAVLADGVPRCSLSLATLSEAANSTFFYSGVDFPLAFFVFTSCLARALDPNCDSRSFWLCLTLTWSFKVPGMVLSSSRIC